MDSRDSARHLYTVATCDAVKPATVAFLVVYSVRAGSAIESRFAIDVLSRAEAGGWR